ncbi:unnamed protein product [Prunus armeniaca]
MAVMIKISSMVVQSQSMNLTHYLKETAWEEPEENLSKLLSQPSEDFSQACEKMFKGCKEFFQYIHQENSLVPTTPPTVEKIENLEEVKNEDQKMVQEQKYEEIPTKEDSQVNFYKDQIMVRVEIDMVVGNKTNLPKSSMAKLELEAKSGFSIHFLWELDPANRDSSWHQQFDSSYAMYAHAGQMRLNLGARVYCMWQVKYQMRLAIHTTYRVWQSINQLSGSLPADIGTGVPDLQQLLVGDNCKASCFLWESLNKA